MSGLCLRAFLIVFAMVIAADRVDGAGLSRLLPPRNLTCDQQPDPLAVVSKQPRFGWMLESRDPGARGVGQSAWRILVSSSGERLNREEGDLWDSGRVVSRETLNVAYQGKALAFERAAFWKVEVWDDRGSGSGWSASAELTMAPADLVARWIAAGRAGSDGGAEEGVTEPMPVFRKQFGIEKPVARAMLYVSGLGQYEAHINGEEGRRR